MRRTARPGGRAASASAAAAAMGAAAIAAIVAGALTASADPPPSLILRLAAALLSRSGASEGLASSVLVLGTAAGLAAIAALVVLDVWARLRGLSGRRPSRWSPPLPGRLAAYAALALLIAAVAWGFRAAWDYAFASPPAEAPAAAIAGPEARTGGERTEPASEDGADGGAAASGPRIAATAVAAAACAAALAAAIAAACKALGPGRAKEERPEDGLARAVAAARRRLETGDVVRDAVIACYAEMCRLYAPDERREREARYLTAREFALALRSRGASDPEIAALTSSFEKARYSNDACGESDRLAAIGALASLESRAAARGDAAPADARPAGAPPSGGGGRA